MSENPRTGTYGVGFDLGTCYGREITEREAEYHVQSFNYKLWQKIGDILQRTVSVPVVVTIRLQVNGMHIEDKLDMLTAELLQKLVARSLYVGVRLVYKITVLLVNWQDAEVGDFVVERAIEAPPDKSIMELWDKQMNVYLFERHGLGWERVR